MSQKKAKFRSRRSIPLETKLEVIKLFEMGYRGTDVAKSVKLPSTTVFTIYKNQDRIKNCLDSSISQNLGPMKNVPKNLVKVKMEAMLNHWIKEQAEKNVDLTPKEIMEKAKVLYRDINELEGPSNEPFIASRGWYMRFCNRSSYMKNKSPMNPNETIQEKPNSFLSVLRSIVVEQNYSRKQVFNLAEMNLFWKRLPKSDCFPSEINDSYSTEKCTVLVCANAAGDFKMKPVLVYNMKNPQALKNYSKSKLPVIWRTNQRGNITPALFNDWFMNYFEPGVKIYYADNGIPNNTLLILENSLSFPTDLNSLFPHIQVVFIPGHTLDQVQPMDQDFLQFFRAAFLHMQLSKLISKEADSFEDCWKSYNILNAVETVSDTWNKFSPKILSSIWHKIWIDCCIEDSTKTFNRIIVEVIEMFKSVNYEGLFPSDVIQLIKSHSDILTGKKPKAKVEKMDTEEVESEAEDGDDDSSDSDEDYSNSEALNFEELTKTLMQAEFLVRKFAKIDPVEKRSSKVCRNMRKAYSCYLQMYRDTMRKQKLAKATTETPSNPVARVDPKDGLIKVEQVDSSNESDCDS